MIIPKQTTVYLRLRILSPIHIGSNEVYEPIGFVVDETNKQLITFEPADFIKMLGSDALDKFSTICQKGSPQSLVEIYQFMDHHKDLAKGKPVAVSEAFIAHFKKTLKLRGERNVLQSLNKFQIKRTAFNPHENVPYIPGSSIKGSIRTAVLNYRNQGKCFPYYQEKESKKMEQDLTGGSFATDPFRLLKVSDFIPVGEVKTRIVYGVNRKKKPSKFDARGPEQIFEVVEPGVIFFGSITIAEVPPNAKIDKPVTERELFMALDQFFGSEKEREDSELKSVDIPSLSLNLVDNQFPLRIGFHSGAECVTVEGHRKIKIMGKGRDSKIDNRTTTFWLAGAAKDSANHSLVPFGWAVLDRISPVEAAYLQDEIEDNKLSQRQCQQELLKKRQQEKKQREEILRLQQEEEVRFMAEKARIEVESQKRVDQWKSLSEEEQDLMIVHGDDLAREFASVRVNNLYQEVWFKLDTVDPKQQKALALAFKERWQKEGNWKVKKAKKKQFAKVQKVKKVLGEVE